MIEVDKSSFLELVRDSVILCEAILQDDNSAEIKALAKQRLSLLMIRINMGAQLAPAEERKAWQELRNFLK